MKDKTVFEMIDEGVTQYSGDSGVSEEELKGFLLDLATKAVEESNSEYAFIFDLYWKRSMRAIKFWQERTGQKEIWPDVGAMMDWFVEEIEKLEKTHD